MVPSDHDLLRQYAHDGSQAAFGTLVDRHLNLVYSAARRQVRSPQLAEEVAQSVFIDLARAARRFPSGTPVVAWLHVVSRRAAIDVIRRESRRQTREYQAAELACGESVESAMKPSSSEWATVEPLLDEAVQSLNETDRTAILLRFFENKSLRDIGAALGASEDAAQKRVTRALDQLRTFFLRRGVAVTAAGLATDLSAHALQVAPAGLGASIASTAAGYAITHAVTAQAITLTMTMLQKTVLITGLVLTAGGALFEANTLRVQRAELAALQQRVDALASEARQTRQQRDVALRRTDEAQQRLAALAAAAKSPADAAMETEMNAWLDRAARLKQLRDQRPDLAIPELALLPDDSWFQQAREAKVETDEQIRDTFAALRNRAEDAFNGKLRRALGSYLDTHGGTLPEDSRELAAFFDPPVDPAILDRYKMTAHGNITDRRTTPLIQQHSPLDFTRDTIWDIQLSGGGSQSALGPYVRKAIQAFTQANNGVKPTLPEQLQPYLPSPVDPAKLEPYLNPRR